MVKLCKICVIESRPKYGAYFIKGAHRSNFFKEKIVPENVSNRRPIQGRLHGFQFGWIELPNLQNLAATTDI